MIHASIHGRLGRDPVARQTRDGRSMATASLAVDVTARQAEERATVWVSVVAFGALAERLLRHRQGELLAAMGPLTLSTWADREGQTRETWQLTVEALSSARLVRPGGGRRRRHGPAPGGGAAAEAPEVETVPFDDFDRLDEVLSDGEGAESKRR